METQSDDVGPPIESESDDVGPSIESQSDDNVNLRMECQCDDDNVSSMKTQSDDVGPCT